ncbi:MAG TPA: glycosyltransferase, partial [Solirubrobacteraceae bacterium]|nr:glycosyltransferase [Solirubrobacteraceae bacterium]
HEVSVWLEEGSARDFEAFFGPAGTVMEGFGAWAGADVAVATGWQTVHRTLLLPGCGARAYLVQDHEPEFYGTSAERTWAEQTYSLGLHCVCASAWLAGLVRERYGASASHFDLGVRHDVYRPLEAVERRERVLFYARAVTPRRAVPLGLLALEELAGRRPGTEVALFGEPRPLATRFPSLGVLPPERLARLYNESAVGLVLSMTNPSLVPTEMLACGLPVVDVASDAMVATFGHDGPVLLAGFDPLALADAIERALDAPRSPAGAEWVASRTWESAAAQLEAGLRAAFS